MSNENSPNPTGPSRLSRLPLPEMKAALDKSIGRPVCSATLLEVTRGPDWVRNDFWWEDGACWSMCHDTEEESHEQALRNGFDTKAPVVIAVIGDLPG